MNGDRPVRFVVLHHTGIAEPHFDLLMDVEGEKLWAWRVLKPPAQWEDGTLPAVRIQDHRRLYLTYEGEISGGRGEVRRVAHGSAAVVEVGDGEIRVRLRLERSEVEVKLPVRMTA